LGPDGKKILATSVEDWAKNPLFYLCLDLLNQFSCQISEDRLFSEVIASLGKNSCGYGPVFKRNLPDLKVWSRFIIRPNVLMSLLRGPSFGANFKTRQEVEMERKESLFQSLHDITSPVCRYAHFSLFIHIKTGFLLIEGIWQCNSFEKKGNLGLLTL
jgi:hypothetical protein